jgi:hypothetical protein
MDFLTNPTMCDQFYAKLTTRSASQTLPHFELLLKTATVSNRSTEIPTEPSIIGYRILD